MRKLLLLAVGLLAIVGAGCDPTSPYAAKVNGTTISQADLNNELTAIHGNPNYLRVLESQSIVPVVGAGEQSFNSSFVADVLTGQIVFQLVHEQVARLGIKINSQDLSQARADIVGGGSPAILNSLPASYRDSLVAHRAEVTALEASLGHVDISPSAVAQYYAAHQQSFVVQCVSDIVLGSQADATAVRADILAGAKFADAARSQSLDKTNGANGGSLGCGPSGRYAAVTGFGQAFDQAVDGLAIGQVSQPVEVQVQTQVGSQSVWHLIVVTSRPVLPIDQVQPQIRATLLSSAQNAYTSTVQRLSSSAHITVNPRYGTFQTLAGQSGVIPPSAPPQSTLNFVPQSTTTTTPPLGP